MESTSNITYRLLPAEEWDRLKTICPEGKDIPSPLVASVVVAEKGDEIVGYLFLQVALHMEPLGIKDHQADYRTMAKILMDALPMEVPFFSCVSDARMEHIAIVLGMHPTGWTVYMGRGGA